MPKENLSFPRPFARAFGEVIPIPPEDKEQFCRNVLEAIGIARTALDTLESKIREQSGVEEIVLSDGIAGIIVAQEPKLVTFTVVTDTDSKKGGVRVENTPREGADTLVLLSGLKKQD